MSDDFEAQDDAFTLIRAKEIEKDQGRVGRARVFAEKKRDQFGQMLDELPKIPIKAKNNSVKNSRMGP